MKNNSPSWKIFTSTICAPQVVPRNLERAIHLLFRLDIIDIIDLSHNPPIPSAFPFPLALPMVRHFESLFSPWSPSRERNTNGTSVSNPSFLKSPQHRKYLATPHAPHFRNTPTWFPILSICQVKCVTLIYPNMIYVVWDRWIWVCSQSSHWKIGLIVRECVLFFWCLNFFSVYCNDLMYILYKTNIPHLGKRNIIFKSGGNMLLVDGFNALISKTKWIMSPRHENIIETTS